MQRWKAITTGWGNLLFLVTDWCYFGKHKEYRYGSEAFRTCFIAYYTLWSSVKCYRTTDWLLLREVRGSSLLFLWNLLIKTQLCFISFIIIPYVCHCLFHVLSLYTVQAVPWIANGVHLGVPVSWLLVFGISSSSCFVSDLMKIFPHFYVHLTA